MSTSASVPSLALLITVGVVAAGMLLAGLVLLVLGLAGRRVDDHPLCRRCRFDLTGRPAGSDRCPECGSPLGSARAIVIGHRRRRGGMITGGLILLFVVLVPATLTLSIMMRGADWRTQMPTWYEMAEARGRALPGDRVLAIEELRRREVIGTLSTQQRIALADAIIACQTDTSVPWNGKWGDWVAQLIADGTLPQPQRDRFLTNILRQNQFSMRPRIRQGDALTLRWSYDNVRGIATWGGSLGTSSSTTDQEILVDGKPIPRDRNSGSTTYHSSLQRGGTTTSYPRVSELDSLPVGDHSIEIRDVVKVTAPGPGGGAATTLLEVPLIQRATLTILPRDAQDVRRVADESLRPAMTEAIVGAKIRLPSSRGGNSMMFDIEFNQPLPMDVAFDIIVRQNGHEWNFGTFARRATEKIMRWSTVVGLHPKPAADPVEGTAEVILRPSEAAARRTVDLFEIWDGEIIFKDVPVTVK